MENSQNNFERLAVFDVCDTLFYSNTTHDFIAFVVSGPEYSLFLRIAYLLLLGRLSPLRYVLIAISVWSGWDVPRALGLRFLSGLTYVELEKAADLFTSSFLSNVKVSQTQNMLRAARDAGFRVVLCSSSIEPIVLAIGRDMGDVDCVGSKLEFHDGIFSGLVSKDTTGRKAEIVRDSYPGAKIELAVSDNLSDIDLLLLAENAFAVIHSSEKLDFWRQYEFEIVDLRI